MSKETSEERHDRWSKEWRLLFKKHLSLLTPYGTATPYFKLLRDNHNDVGVAFYTHTYEYELYATLDIPASVKKKTGQYRLVRLWAVPRKPIAGQTEEERKNAGIELLSPITNDNANWTDPQLPSLQPDRKKYEWHDIPREVMNFELVKILKAKRSIFEDN